MIMPLFTSHSGRGRILPKGKESKTNTTHKIIYITHPSPPSGLSPRYISEKHLSHSKSQARSRQSIFLSCVSFWSIPLGWTAGDLQPERASEWEDSKWFSNRSSCKNPLGNPPHSFCFGTGGGGGGAIFKCLHFWKFRAWNPLGISNLHM